MSPEQVSALRAGDPQAVDAFYRQHAPLVLGWCVRLGGPLVDPEDAAHEVFEKALQKLPAFRGDAKLSTWLYGITRRVLANLRRRAAIRRFVGMHEIPEPEARADTEAEVARMRERRRVQHVLERLPDRSREVLVLADLEGRSAPEVSELLGVPTGTVYSRLHTARRAFKAACKAEGLVVREGQVLRLVKGGRE
ncbi:MAG: RNA polymerase sigma factor [Alphaproteobacteria bacterium]|nr:RNA polymerase sigma factor [Alphaproteobacteria bacterium]MCB9793979.1 RNA polymerase sigma factor [Alphaproteobacteria bacterium]